MSKSEGKLIYEYNKNEMQKKEMKKNRNFSIKMFVHPDLLFYSQHYTMHRQRVNVRDEFYSRVRFEYSYR